MKHKIIIAAVALTCAIPAFTQNLNPQVQVTNDYKAELGKAGKQSVPLEIPDSLNSFRTSVSYNVFATPYKGSYEFVPYEISVTPQKPAPDYNKFYLKAGAGYPLRPELKAVWTPVRSLSGNTLTVFQDLHGYAGNYGTLDSRDDYSGYDISETFGLEGRWFGNSFSLAYGLDYQGLFNNDFTGKSNFNDFTLRTAVRSDADSRILYDFDLAVSQAFDSFVSQTAVKACGGFLPNWMLPFDLRIDFNLETDIYANDIYDNAFVAQIAAKALFDWDPVRLSAGVSVSPASDLQWLYPDVQLTADLFDNVLQAYATVKGGQFVRGYADLKLENHWFNPAYTAAIKPTLERLNATLGLRGSALKYLQYDIRGGWASYSDAPLHSFTASIFAPPVLDCGIAYADYNTVFADADIHWKSPRFALDLSAGFKHTNIELNDDYLDLPAFTGAVSAVYNWNSRIFAGLTCKGRTEQAALTWSVPGFADLGLIGEYSFNNRFGVWANVGNLLCHEIALSPLHVQKGIYFTGGIRLNLR